MRPVPESVAALIRQDAFGDDVEHAADQFVAVRPRKLGIIDQCRDQAVQAHPAMVQMLQQGMHTQATLVDSVDEMHQIVAH